MSLRVISHTPTINDIEVYRNQTIEIKFDKEIVPSSVTYSTMSVNDSSTYVSVPGEYSIGYVKYLNNIEQAADWVPSGNYYAVPQIVKFTPDLNLSANSKYKVFIYGGNNSILSSTGEALSETYNYEFTTGNLITVNESGGLPVDPEGSGVIPDPNESITIPSTIPSGTLTIYETNPADGDANVSNALAAITMTMNVIPSGDISQYINIVEKDVLV